MEKFFINPPLDFSLQHFSYPISLQNSEKSEKFIKFLYFPKLFIFVENILRINFIHSFIHTIYLFFFLPLLYSSISITFPTIVNNFPLILFLFIFLFHHCYYFVIDMVEMGWWHGVWILQAGLVNSSLELSQRHNQTFYS